MATRRRSQLPGNDQSGGDLEFTNSGSTGDLVTKGSTEGTFTFAAPSSQSIGNGSIDPVKLADISTGADEGGKGIRLADNGVDFALFTPFTLTASSVAASNLNAGTATNDYVLVADSTETGGFAWKINAPANSTITPAKIADITVGSGIAGKLLGFNSDNHAEFEVIDPFTVSDIGAGEITNTMLADESVDIDTLDVSGTQAAGKVIKVNATNNGLEWADDSSGGGGGGTPADGSVGIDQLDIDGTAAVGQIAKVYSDSGTLKLQWSADSTGSGGGVSLPINLAGGSSVVTGDLPVADGGTGASTAAAARANLGVQASGGTSTEAGDLPTVTAIDAQPAGHIGEWVSASTGKPDSGSDSGVVERLSGGDQIATVGETGTTYFRTHSTSVDANWGAIGTPSPALPSVTTIAQMRAITDYQIVSSTFTGGNPQNVASCIIARFPGGFGGHGFLCAIPPGGVGFWVAEVPSASFNASDLSWQTWEFSPLPPEFSQYLHRDGAYEKVPAGQTGLVLDLQIAAATIADAFVSHTYTSSTTSSEYSADFYTTGSTVRESTRGHTHSIGSWAKTQIGTDQVVDEAITEPKIDDGIITVDGSGNAVVAAPVIDLHTADFPGYTVVSSSNQLSVGSGRIWFDYPNRRFFAAERSDVEHGLLSRVFNKGFELTITGTSSGDTGKYVEGVLTQRVTLPGGLVGGIFRDDWGTSAVQFAADDTVTIAGKPAFLNKDDTIKLANLGLTHGTSNANRIVYTDAEGDGFTTLDHITPTELPTALADINALNERLTVRQRLEPRDFGTTYSHSASASGVTAGRIRWNDTSRELTINPLAADDKLVEYFSVLGVDVELTSTNGAVIHSTVEAVVSNPAGTPAGAITVRLKNLAHHYAGDIRSGTVTIKTLGSFIGRGDTAAVQRDALDAGTGSAGQVLSRTSTGLAWVNQSSGGGGGDTFTAAEYSSKVFSTDYNRNATLTGLPAGDYYWDDTNKRLTINPASADTDLTTRTPAGARFELRGASGLRLDGIISSRPDNPAGAPSGAFTLQFDTAAQTFYQSSGFAASTANMTAYCHGKVASWDAMNSTVSGLFGSIDREMLDTTNSPSNGQVLGVGSTLDTSDRRLVWVDYTAPRSAQILANHQTTNGGSISTNSFTDAASLLALPSFEIENLNDMLDFVFTGVLYFNAGTIGSIGIEARLQYRYATTSAGLSTASWNVASMDLTGGLDDAELIFRSKLAAGGTGDGSFRDYMPSITAWGSIDSLTTGPAVGNHIEFRIQFRMPSNSGFNTVNSYYSWRQRVMICPATS